MKSYLESFDKLEYIRLYVNLEMSYREVAKKMGLSPAQLRYAQQKFKLPTRDKSQASKIAFKKGKLKPRKGKDNPNYRHGKSKDKLYQRVTQYGLNEKQYASLLYVQNNKCAICKELFVKTPDIDHCHTDGTVRGLLCSPCNKGLGHFKDNITYLTKAINYLKEGFNG